MEKRTLNKQMSYKQLEHVQEGKCFEYVTAQSLSLSTKRQNLEKHLFQPVSQPSTPIDVSPNGKKSIKVKRKSDLNYRATNLYKIQEEHLQGKKGFAVVGRKVVLQQRLKARDDSIRTTDGFEITLGRGNRREIETVAVETGDESKQATRSHITQLASGTDRKSTYASINEAEANVPAVNRPAQPSIRVTIPPPASGKPARSETITTGSTQSTNKARTYMVCRKSLTNTSEWRTMYVDFPRETTEYRRLSHRNSSFSSLNSFGSQSFSNLSLACKTPQYSPLSSPINCTSFVFPSMHRK